METHFSKRHFPPGLPRGAFDAIILSFLDIGIKTQAKKTKLKIGTIKLKLKIFFP